MNARLVNLFSLSHKVTAYIPATINVNETIDNTEYVNKMAAIMSDCFGGATSTPANGYWLSSEIGLVKESTTMVFAYAENLDRLDPVIDYMLELKSELSQEAMALEVDGQMFFI